MKKYIAGGTSKNKLFEVQYYNKIGELEGTATTKVAAKDILDAIDILMNVEKVDASDIEYVARLDNEIIIG